MIVLACVLRAFAPFDLPRNTLPFTYENMDDDTNRTFARDMYNVAVQLVEFVDECLAIVYKLHTSRLCYSG